MPLPVHLRPEKTAKAKDGNFTTLQAQFPVSGERPHRDRRCEGPGFASLGLPKVIGCGSHPQPCDSREQRAGLLAWEIATQLSE